jgi:glycosyltransferase involved in cell wall biosynthesis
MKVAVVHDWLEGTGGAERVTKALAELFKADVFALVDFLSDSDRQEVLQGRHARTSIIQRLPFSRSHFRWYLPLFPYAIEHLDLRGYDLVISASYAVAKGVKKRNGQKHVCYIHTPMRYAWVDEEGYLKEHRMSGWKAALVRWNMRRFRAWDQGNNASIDRFVANSRNVAERVSALYPPVDPLLFQLYEGARHGFVSASRLVPYKRIDRIIEAFRTLPEHTLTIIGDGPYRATLERMAPPNVRFTGHLPQHELTS